MKAFYGALIALLAGTCWAVDVVRPPIPARAAAPALPAAPTAPAAPAAPDTRALVNLTQAAPGQPVPSPEQAAAAAGARFDDSALQTEYGEVADGPFPFKYGLSRTQGSESRDVLYFLHGGGGDERNWAEAWGDLRRHWRRLGKPAPIVVSVSFGQYWALAPRNGGPMGGMLEHFVDRVMPFMEAKVGGPVDRRLLLGHSMGGLNVLELVLQRPALFAAAAASSPALLDVNPHASQAELEAFARKIGVPLEHLSGVIQLARNYFPDEASWNAFNPLKLGERMSAATPPLHVSCGDKDVFHPAACAVAKLAAEKAVDVVWQSLPGGDHGTIDVAELARFLVPWGLRLTPAEVKAENELLAGLGFDLKGQDFLQRAPFEAPQSSYRALLVPASAASAAPPSTVSADALRADLPLLEVVLRRAYGGWEHARDRGWDWKGWFARWRAHLAARRGQTLPVAEAFAPVEELQRFQPDNHTRPVLPGRLFAHVSSTALLQEAPAGAVTALITEAGETIPVDPRDLATQPRPVRLGDAGGDFSALPSGWALSYPSGYGRAVAAIAGGKRIALTPDYDPSGEERAKAVLALAQTPADGPSYRRLSPEVGYLRLPTMIGENAAAYENLTRRLPTLSDGAEKVVIVDARGNLGGQLWFGPLTRWFDPRELLARGSSLIPRGVQKTSALTDALFWTLHSAMGDLKAPLSQVVRETFQDLLDRLLRPFRPERVRLETRLGGGFDFDRRRFDPAAVKQGPLVLLLTDNYVASNGESLTGLLATFPNTLLAGVSTAGVGEFGNVGEVYLPNSKIRYHVATDHNFIFPDGRSFESHGLMPDVLLNTERSNSPAHVIALAQSLAALRP